MTSYKPAWWLLGPHRATLWGKFGRREPLHAVRWEQLATPDGDFVELAHLDAAHAPVADLSTRPAHDAPAPRLLLMHGLEGAVDAKYVRGFMREASARGWNSTLMLFRTCGPTPNRLPRSYHSGDTGDLKFVVETLTKRDPGASLGIAAVSLGGNVLCKYLGESGATVPEQVRGSVAISTPFDLAKASRFIGRGFGKIYELAFLRSLVPKAVAKIARHSELCKIGGVEQVRTIWAFDDLFTSPVHGFRDAADYYARSSSLQFLKGITTPTLLLNAADDPFLPPQVLEEVVREVAGNSAITVEFPKRGGHVGFTAGRNPFKPFYYGEWRAAQFLAEQFHRGHAPDRSHSHLNLTQFVPAVRTTSSSDSLQPW